MKKILLNLILLSSLIFGQNIDFEDINFKYFAIYSGFDTNQDGEVSETEALNEILNLDKRYTDFDQNLVNFYVQNFSYPPEIGIIESIEDIKHFKNVTRLDLRNHKIDSVVFPEGLKLDWVMLESNEIKFLDINNLSNFTWMNVSWNEIVKVDATLNTSFETLLAENMETLTNLCVHPSLDLATISEMISTFNSPNAIVSYDCDDITSVKYNHIDISIHIDNKSIIVTSEVPLEQIEIFNYLGSNIISDSNINSEIYATKSLKPGLYFVVFSVNRNSIITKQIIVY